MVPTKRFWLLLLLGVPLGALAALAGAPLFVVIYDIALIAAAYVTTRMAPSTGSLRFRRDFDPVLSVRVMNKVALIVSNDGVEPVTALLRDEAPSVFEASQREFRLNVEPGKEQRIEYSVTPKLRGTHRFLGTFLRVDCPLGLVTRQEKIDTDQDVRVYPNVLAMREFDLLKQRGRLREIGIRRARLRGLGTEFESLREYSEGDDYRKIDHKASARRGKLMVRQYEQERNQTVILCIDIGRLMLSEVSGANKLDHVLDSIIMLANAVALAGDLVGLLVYCDNVRRYIPPRKGRAQVGVVIEALHDLLAEPTESDPVTAFGYLSRRWNRRSLVVNFTDFDDPDVARSMVMAMGPLSRRHYVLTVRVQDPRLDEIRKAEPSTLESLYQKAAAEMLLTDRRDALLVAQTAGIHVLTSEPQDLASNLVSYYFMVKERSLL